MTKSQPTSFHAFSERGVKTNETTLNENLTELKPALRYLIQLIAMTFTMGIIYLLGEGLS